jgi:energy-coupling factor transport system ATP-binding protein
VLELNDVAYRYGSDVAPHQALSSVSLTVAPGELVCVVGANGSGKSTLVRLCNGLALASRGEVLVDGRRIGDADSITFARTRVALVFQNPDDQIVATAVEDDVAFGPENLGVPVEEIRTRVDEALAAVGLTGMEDREPHLLSGGQKQRVAIAGALALRPRYLVLDEPTSMLDPMGRQRVVESISRVRASGCGVLLVTHDLGECLTADRIVVIAEGTSVATFEPAALMANSSKLEGWGVELPALTSLGRILGERGVGSDPLAADAAAFVESLCR